MPAYSEGVTGAIPWRQAHSVLQTEFNESMERKLSAIILGPQSEWGPHTMNGGIAAWNLLPPANKQQATRRQPLQLGIHGLQGYL